MSYTNSQFPAQTGMSATCRNMITNAMEMTSFIGVKNLVERTFQIRLSHESQGNGTYVQADLNGTGPFRKMSFEQCDVYVAQMICDSPAEHQQVLSTIASRAESGDIVILESVDLSNGYCFPYHSAFDRFLEILASYQQLIGHPTKNDELKALNHSLSSDPVIQMGVPVKLQGDQKSLPGLVLEAIRPCVESANIISLEEFDTVTAELNRLGRDNQVAIRYFTINRIMYRVIGNVKK